MLSTEKSLKKTRLSKMSKNGKMVMLRAKNQANKATHFIQPQKASKGPLHLSGILRGKGPWNH